MKVSRLGLTIPVALAVLALPPLQRPAHAGKTADAIAAGLIGAAVVAAASKHHRHQQKYYYNNYQEPYPRGGYDGYWSNNVFKPKGDVICYRAQVACYNLNGSFNAKWTQRAFADGE